MMEEEHPLAAPVSAYFEACPIAGEGVGAGGPVPAGSRRRRVSVMVAVIKDDLEMPPIGQRCWRAVLGPDRQVWRCAPVADTLQVAVRPAAIVGPGGLV